MTAWRASVLARLGAFELDVSLRGGDGVLALVGPNGSGKTTFLRSLVGAVPAIRADIEVSGVTLADTQRGVDMPIERRRVGYVPQGYGLFEHLTALDNVAFGLSTWPHRLGKAQRHAKARAILGELGVASLAERGVAGLSGGEKQRIALARALVLEPHLLLLDEPLAALDATTRRRVRRFLTERLRAFGRPTILVTHDVRDVQALGAQVAVLECGRLLQVGDLDALRRHPASDFVAEFVDALGPPLLIEPGVHDA